MPFPDDRYIARIDGVRRVPRYPFQLAGPDAMGWEMAIPYMSKRLGHPYLEIETPHTHCCYEFDVS